MAALLIESVSRHYRPLRRAAAPLPHVEKPLPSRMHRNYLRCQRHSLSSMRGDSGTLSKPRRNGSERRGRGF